MEAVLKNVERTVELLAVSQTEIVKRWDKQTLDRAFQWTRYCEQLYTKFHANPTARDCLEKQLQVTNERLHVTFQNYMDITLYDLSQCQHMLLVGLLNNADLPNSSIRMLFETNSGAAGEECKNLTGYCTELIAIKSVCKTLRSINLKCSGSLPGPDAEVVGKILMDILDTMLNPTCSPKLLPAQAFLDSILQTCGENVTVFSVFAAALASKKQDSNKTTVTSASEDFLLDWLQKHPGLQQNTLTMLPSDFLRDASRHSVKFRVAYRGMLKHCASQCEYDMNTVKPGLLLQHQNELIYKHQLAAVTDGSINRCLGNHCLDSEGQRKDVVRLPNESLGTQGPVPHGRFNLPIRSALRG